MKSLPPFFFLLLWLCSMHVSLFSWFLSFTIVSIQKTIMLSPTWEGWRGTGNWEGTQPGQLTQTSQRDIPYHMMSCWVYKLGEEEGSGGHLALWRLSSQVTVTRDGALLSWGWLNTCLPMGSGEWIPCFALLACMSFALPIKLSLSQPMSFLTFTQV